MTSGPPRLIQTVGGVFYPDPGRKAADLCRWSPELLSYPKDAQTGPSVLPLDFDATVQPQSAGGWVHGDHPVGGVAELRGCREVKKGMDGSDGLESGLGKSSIEAL